MNLDKVVHFAAEEHSDMVPEAPHAGSAAQAQCLRQHCDDVPKPMKWKLRAKVGDRVQGSRSRKRSATRPASSDP